ncbi:asparagine synthase (glutamine-hydrolyzing) [Roseospirillum parvum]|uniref:asparagine synthase (glutamine-hydrolyzing) n=1 Tax=Roseospirillum parvum TaxID=83401 RepID=A0A1G7Z8T6_9PROT|nr:asparagine synthase (glutamine-hydrolyzing) [Roseospirillum parvum]SDH05104.1 asparagine synthase (glutamine-hydrolysing) [Roseospirillum parvum]
MCGLAAVVDLAAAGLPAEAAGGMARALERLTPRGPDGGGVWADAHCRLGHRRLAVIDLSPGGAQPMAGHGLVLTYNGEIYNYRQLRAELEQAGVAVAGDSDSAVLLAGWAHWGAGLLPRLNGMFAFALWDGRARELILARDRMGKKPLYLRTEGGRLAVASDLVALGHVWPGGWSLDRAGLATYFALGYSLDPQTVLSEAKTLPAGHMARFSARGLEVRRWHHPVPPAPITDSVTDPGEAAGRLRAAVDGAAAARLVADVPVGAFLSGGIDSAVVCAALVAGGHTVNSYTIGSAGAADYYEERPAARRIAAHLGLAHTEIEIDPAGDTAWVEPFFEAMDAPFADSSAIPTFLLAREMRRHLTVALSGDGADEVFGGYRKYQGELHAARYQRLPAALRRRLIEPLARRLPEGKDSALMDASRKARRFLAHAGADPVARQAGWMRRLSAAELAALGLPEADIESAVAAARGDIADPLNALLAADMALVLAGDMLVKVDRFSMAHALEVRSPFLDPAVVDLAAALPGELKIRPGAGKWILRHAFADRLPAEVFARPKKGFEIPLAQWLQGPLAGPLAEATDAARLTARGLIDPTLPALWRDRLGRPGHDPSWHLWSLICLDQWLARHGPVFGL